MYESHAGNKTKTKGVRIFEAAKMPALTGTVRKGACQVHRSLSLSLRLLHDVLTVPGVVLTVTLV